MADPQGQGAGLWITAAVAAISVVGGLTKSTEWRDAKTGKFSPAAMVSGICTCLILASIVRWSGDTQGISPTAQVMIAGVLCYLGPDPIIRSVASIGLKRIGVQQDGNGNDTKGT